MGCVRIGWSFLRDYLILIHRGFLKMITSCQVYANPIFLVVLLIICASFLIASIVDISLRKTPRLLLYRLRLNQDLQNLLLTWEFFLTIGEVNNPASVGQQSFANISLSSWLDGICNPVPNVFESWTLFNLHELDEPIDLKKLPNGVTNPVWHKEFNCSNCLGVKAE